MNTLKLVLATVLEYAFAVAALVCCVGMVRFASSWQDWLAFWCLFLMTAGAWWFFRVRSARLLVRPARGDDDTIPPTVTDYMDKHHGGRW